MTTQNRQKLNAKIIVGGGDFKIFYVKVKLRVITYLFLSQYVVKVYTIVGEKIKDHFSLTK